MNYLTGKTIDGGLSCIRNQLKCLLIAGWVILQIQPLTALAAESFQQDKKIRIAACQFPVSASIPENASWIEQQMREAAETGAGELVDRYDKRFCTRGDLKFFSAGDHFVVFDLKGIRCGLLICFDVRFPELYREYRKMDVDIIFQSFYNARQKPGGIHPKIMPVTAQAHAGINHFFLSLTNSSAPRSWPCHLITPDGLIQEKLTPDKPGILASEIDLSKPYYDASKGLRENALQKPHYSYLRQSAGFCVAAAKMRPAMVTIVTTKIISTV